MRQGPLSNVIATPPGWSRREPLMFVGAHFDSVPGSPGADDNASAVAVMLDVAEALANRQPIGIAAFNGEEDGLDGSRDFVRWARRTRLPIAGIHVLEMVGFTSPTQEIPLGLVPQGLERGDFLAIVGAGRSRPLLRHVMQAADVEPSAPPTVGLFAGRFPRLVPRTLHRSDHSPFWLARRPALMWTDTADYRNPHYHQATDTPDTLDYDFMHRVSMLLRRVLSSPIGVRAKV